MVGRGSSRRGGFWGWVLLLVLVSVVARLPLCWDRGTVRNDGAEYLAVARSLRQTGEFASDLKYHFYSDDPIRHAAWGDRPPLYPVMAAGAQRLFSGTDSAAVARLLNVALTALALMLGAAYLRRRFGETVSLLASGYFFLLPFTVYWTVQPMTEALSLALSLGALLAWDHVRPGGRGAALAAAAGLLVGLNYLTRPTGGLLFPVLLLEVWRRPLWRGLGWPLAVGFLLPVVPYHGLLWWVYANPLYTTLGYTFSVRNYYAVTYHGFEATRLSTGQYLSRHGGEVPGLLLSQGWNHLQSLMLPLLPWVPFLGFRRAVRRDQWCGRVLVIPVFTVLTFAVHTAAWTAWGSTRYFLLPILLLSALLLWQGRRVRRSARGGEGLWPLGLGVAAVGLAVGLVQLYAREGRPDRGIAALPTVRYAAERVRGDQLIAADKPSLFNVLLEKPAVLLPRTVDRAQLTRFVQRYQPEVLVLIPDQPLRGEALAMADAWRNGGLPPGWFLAEDRSDLLIARRKGPERE